MKSLSIGVILLVSITYRLQGQDYPNRDYDLERLADEIFPLQDLDLDYSELYENLLQLISNPLDLNRASREQFRSLFILSGTQIQSLLDYREQNGPIISVYELQAVPDLDQIAISRLIPFVTVRSVDQTDQSLLKRIFSEENNYFILRNEYTLEEKKGYQIGSGIEPAYRGSPNKIYARFRVSHGGDFSLGFTTEKDAGEKLEWNPDHKVYGSDYYSFHGQVMNKGKIKNLIIGDYQVQFGQGLILGGGFGSGKGAETITTVRRSNLGFLPYTSLNENGFFRGLAMTIGLSKTLSLNAFFSHQNADATVASDSIGNTISLSSLTSSGFHRTANELNNKRSIAETNTGLVFGYNKNSLNTGLIFHLNDFEVPINRTPTLYNQFTFQGDRIQNTGAYLNYGWNNFTFFSEVAHTLNEGTGLVAGTLANLSRQFDLSLVYRYYERDYQTFHGNAFGESSIPQNESGFYWGWKYTFNRRYLLAGYFDLFRFPWLRFRGYAPSEGNEWLMRLTFRPNRETTIFIQAKEENKIRNLPEAIIYETGSAIKRNYWVNLDYAISKHLTMKSRAQFSTFQLAGTTTAGFTLIQDLNLNLRKFSISTRYALFDTDDYDNRQYVYERDVWLAYSFPAYYGVGVRSYVLVQYKLHRSIDLWFRWAQTYFTDRSVIGSGNETIIGNRKNDLKFQVRFKL